MKLGLVAASSSQTYTLDYIPEMIGIRFNATGTLNSITITTDDGTLVNLSDSGFKVFAQSFKFSAVDATSDVFYIPVAAGMIANKQCTIYVTTNAGASGIDVYATSTKEALIPVTYKTYQTDVIANGNTYFKQFGRLAILSMGASDVLTWNSNVGSSSDRLLIEELAALGTMYYDNSATPEQVVINNEEGIISSIVFSPTAQRTCVVQQTSVGGSIDKREIAAKIDNVIERDMPRMKGQSKIAVRTGNRGLTKRGY
jgi:hypothetical protein